MPASASGASAPVYQSFSKVIGHSRQGRPVTAYFRGDPRAAHQVLILGQMHGNEPAGPQVADRVKDHLRPRAGTGMWVIPSMNPDGRRRGTRQNARKVDLNRNWPSSGWTGRASTRYWGGPKATSEPETQAMVRFLRQVKPDLIASLHQPFGKIDTNGKDKVYEARLKQALRLPGQRIPVSGVPHGKVEPTLTGWYNAILGKNGTSVTVELPARTTAAYRNNTVAPGLMRATLLWPSR